MGNNCKDSLSRPYIIREKRAGLSVSATPINRKKTGFYAGFLAYKLVLALLKRSLYLAQGSRFNTDRSKPHIVDDIFYQSGQVGLIGNAAGGNS